MGYAKSRTSAYGRLELKKGKAFECGRECESACVCEVAERAEKVERRFLALEDARWTPCAFSGGDVTSGGREE